MTTETKAHKYPSAKVYWATALVLMVLTAIEIGISYLPDIDRFRGLLLVAFGAAKFVIVVAIFMHLRYEAPRYRTYFLLGVGGALIVFAVVLATFQAL